MIKKKLAAIATAAVAACSITATAFATTYTVPKYPFGPETLTQGGPYKDDGRIKKEDNLSAWIDVEQGLSSGEAYVTFRVLSTRGYAATNAVDVWTNGERYIDYYSDMGVEKQYYTLRYYMEPQRVNSVYIGGIWAP